MSIKFTRNADGSTIGVLSAPVTVGPVSHDRITIPALKGKHMRKFGMVLGDGSTTIGVLIQLAAEVVEPAGIVDEMAPSDAMDVGLEVLKYITGKGVGSA